MSFLFVPMTSRKFVLRTPIENSYRLNLKDCSKFMVDAVITRHGTCMPELDPDSRSKLHTLQLEQGHPEDIVLTGFQQENAHLTRREVQFLVRVLDVDETRLEDINYNLQICALETCAQYLSKSSAVAEAKKKIQLQWEQEHSPDDNPVKVINAEGHILAPKGTSCAEFSTGQKNIVEQCRTYFLREADVVKVQGVAVNPIPENDPREALRGQAGLFATETLPPYQLLGPYAGEVVFQGNFYVE